MSSTQDYSAQSLEELRSEEKKLNNKKITAAVLVGFLVGIMIFGLATGGFKLLYTLIPILLIAVIVQQSQKQKQALKEIQLEIQAKQKA